MQIPSWAEGAAAALVVSAAVRALPAPPDRCVGFWQNLYLWFFNFVHSVLANWDKIRGSVGVNPAKLVGPLILLLLMVPCAMGQTPPTPAEQNLPNEFYAAGMAFNQTSSPQLAGWISYGHKLSNTIYLLNTYDLTAIKGTAEPGKLALPQIQAQARIGAAVYLRSFGSRVMLFGLGDAGMAATGQTVGSSFSGGGLAIIDLGKGWAITLPIRVIKNSASGAQYVPEFGIVYGGK